MRTTLRGKLHSNRGVNRLVAILATLLAVLILAAIYPAYRLYKRNADEVGCLAAMKKAQDMLDVEFLSNYSLTLEEAEAVVERSKWEMDTVCPAGGDSHLVLREDSEQIYRIVCGLHDPDTRERTRLNALSAYEQLKTSLYEAKRRGREAPETVTVTLNGRAFTIERQSEPNELRYGTDSSTGYKGTVSYYSVDEEENLFWFVYADPNHAAVWRAEDSRVIRVGWSGDAFSD
jgi:hypothetical protein